MNAGKIIFIGGFAIATITAIMYVRKLQNDKKATAFYYETKQKLESLNK